MSFTNLSKFVKVENCEVRGQLEKDCFGESYISFLGIPYAKPPINDLRFKDPVPKNIFEEETIFEANKQKCLCPTNYMGKDSNEYSEDCLYLNVYTPISRKKNTLLPVMVYVHNNAFVECIDVKNDRGPDFLLRKSVILVTFEYRCGILGSLHFTEPLTDVPGNAGLKDIIEVLKWIQKYIRYFDGDYGNITVFGHGYGGVAAHLLLFSPLSKDLFHKLIVQSGSILSPWVSVPRFDEKFADIMNFRGFSNRVDMLKHLQAQSVQDLIMGQNQYSEKLNLYGTEMYAFGPVVESFGVKRFLTDKPINLLRAGSYHKVPLIIGYDKFDGTILQEFTKLDPEYTDNSLLVPRYIHDLVPNSERISHIGDKIRKIYCFKDENENYTTMTTDLGFAFGIQNCIEEHLKLLPVIYHYIFGCETLLNKHKDRVSYGDSIKYLICQPETKKLAIPNTPEYECIDLMTTLWTNFAHTSSPNPIPNAEVIWEPVYQTPIDYLEITKPLQFTVVPNLFNLAKLDKIFQREIKRRKSVICTCIQNGC